MHDGRFKTLSKVIQHYTSGINYSLHLPKELKKPIQLSSDQKVELISFLFTLNDSSFVFNKQYSYLK
jgi:cytochrome c peroxidase